ncbi:PREDICTED: protein aubergine-like [Diuraphis noxia]|uniref:protein aubergine-like n=1 Tax=Diuraphis noxia TaxID=143948 RepID=UPI000763AE52|nr:PREDICTED: protein aubergine-like [Diuraphis noxia]
MDQNPIDDSSRNVHDLGPIYFGTLHDESEVNEEELRPPTLGNNRNFQRFQGLLGDPVDLVTNCIQIFCDPNWKLQKYGIHFKPNVNRNIKNELLIKHISFLGEYVLDGNTMYSFVKYESKTFTIYEQYGLSGSLVMITINHLSEVEGSDIATMPIVLKFFENCLRHLKFVKAESFYFDREATITHQKLGLCYWPGYLLGVRKCNDQFALCVELLNSCTASKTVLDFFHVSCGNNRNISPSLMNNFKASVIGTVVLTSYNNKLYKIHGVNENLNINSTFIDEDGLRISYKDYYEQKWNISSLDEQQPMLKTTNHDNYFDTLYLVPQLCIITEFTDIIR